MRFVGFAMAAFMLNFAFSNCAPTKFEGVAASDNKPAGNPIDPNPGGPTPVPTPKPPGHDNPQVDPVKEACKNGVIEEVTHDIVYANPIDSAADRANTCGFGVNGVSSGVNDHFMARVEQDFKFSLPAGSKICSVDFNFPTQDIHYDDWFFLAFDEAMLATSYPINDGRLATYDGIMTYDWERLKGTAWPQGNNGSQVYCLGQESGHANCSWPETQANGQISMTFNPAVFQGITAKNLGRTEHVFKFITTGDNDPQVDCQHKPVSFSIKVKYSKN